MYNLMDGINKVLFTREEIAQRVHELGEEITRDCEDSDLIVIGILNGGLEDVLAKGAAICTECVGLG